MIIEIPIKAVPKGRPKGRVIYKNKRPICSMYTPENTAKFERYIKNHCLKHANYKLNSILRVVIEVFITPAPSMSQKKKDELYGSYLDISVGDWDNFAKSICDGMNGVVYKDDVQIVDGRVIKKYGRENLIRIEITEIKKTTHF